MVLVNNTDWELLVTEISFLLLYIFLVSQYLIQYILGKQGELEYKVEDKDEIVFISTLHGG